MPWVKLDDGYWRNPKVRAVGPLGAALHLAAACWSAEHLTDGFIPRDRMRDVLRDAQVTTKLLRTCVEHGLLHETNDGYILHDWEYGVRSKETVEKQRARWAKTKNGQRHPAELSTDSPRVDTAVESSGVSRCPVPVPVPNDLHPPTTESQGPTLNGGGRGEEILELMVRHERSVASDIRDERAWMARVRTNLAERHAAEIERVCARYPDAPSGVIAGYVRGETANLRYYQQTDATP